MSLDDQLPEPSCHLANLEFNGGRHVCRYHKNCDYKQDGKGGMVYCGYLEQLRNETELKLLSAQGEVGFLDADK